MRGAAGSVKLIASVLLAVTTAARAVGPDYRRPSAPVSAAYKEQPPSATPTPTVDATQWKPAEPRDDARRGKWWEVFGGPALAALEEQVTVSNQTLAQS